MKEGEGTDSVTRHSLGNRLGFFKLQAEATQFARMRMLGTAGAQISRGQLLHQLPAVHNPQAFAEMRNDGEVRYGIMIDGEGVSPRTDITMQLELAHMRKIE